LQYVLHGKEVVGFLMSAGPKGYRAYDQDGKPLGLFSDEHEAPRAVYDVEKRP
jgi:hypothetical protein